MLGAGCTAGSLLRIAAQHLRIVGTFMSDIAAFFDLDRTIIRVNSAILWAKHERKRGFISRRQLARSLMWSALYHLSLVDMERAYEEAVSHYRGSCPLEMDRLTRDWFYREVVPHTRPGALEAIAWHRAQGHPLVLLTSASSFEAEVAMEHWGFDAWIANEFPVQDGKIAGSFVSPLVYGDGKVHHATRYAQAHGVSLERSYFYSDSYSDRPMLEAVGEPRVVAPDPRLRRFAARRAWPVLQWDTDAV